MGGIKVAEMLKMRIIRNILVAFIILLFFIVVKIYAESECTWYGTGDYTCNNPDGTIISQEMDRYSTTWRVRKDNPKYDETNASKRDNKIIIPVISGENNTSCIKDVLGHEICK